MQKHPDVPTIVFSISIIVMMIGASAIYFDPYEIDSKVEWTDDGWSCEVTSSFATEFKILGLETGIFDTPYDIHLYSDTAYGSVSAGANEDSLDDMIVESGIRGVSIIEVDSEELATLLSRGDPAGTAVIFTGGTFPSTIYDGTRDSVLLKWVESGGTIYWMSGLLGAYIGHPDGTVSTVPDYEEIFFGEASINDSNHEDVATDRIEGLSDDLCLRNWDARFGLSSSVSNVLSLGYMTDDGFCTIAMAPFSQGMIVVVGGGFNDATRSDMAQIVASGLTYSSSLQYCCELSLEEGSNTIHDDSPSIDLVYVFAGGYYTHYGIHYSRSVDNG